MKHKVPLIGKIVAKLIEMGPQERSQLKQELLAGANPDHGPVMLSYLFNKEHDLRPRFRLCRNLENYGGHDLPQQTPEVAEALRLRTQKRKKNPDFTRYLYKRNHFDPSYRRERGLHNKRRREVEGRGANVKIGYRTPRLCRYFGPLGHPQVLVTTEKQIGQVPPTSVVRIAKVGLRTRFKLEHCARTKRLWVANSFKWGVVCNN